MSESKTAVELRQLLDRIEDPNNSNAAGCMADLWCMAPDLARRVIAAEKLVGANSDMEEAIRSFLAELRPNCPLVPKEIHEAIQSSHAALTAYREASK